MPDISMCRNTSCPLKSTCYRFRAIPSMRQSYAGFEWDNESYCEHYVQIIPTDKLSLVSEHDTSDKS